MQDLIIYDVPDKLFEGLHDRAARHRRSIQGELMALLEVAIAESDGLGLPFNPTPLPGGRTSVRRGWKTVEQDYAECLARQPVPALTDPSGQMAGLARRSGGGQMTTLTLDPGMRVAEPAVRFLARSPIVVDASMVCAILFDGGLREQSTSLIAERSLYAPYLLDHEIVTEALRRFPGPGAAASIAAAMERYRELEISLCDTDVQAQFDLALRYRISAFAAAYLCLAAELRSPLATFDPQLSEAARAHLSSLD